MLKVISINHKKHVVQRVLEYCLTRLTIASVCDSDVSSKLINTESEVEQTLIEMDWEGEYTGNY